MFRMEGKYGDGGDAGDKAVVTDLGGEGCGMPGGYQKFCHILLEYGVHYAPAWGIGVVETTLLLPHVSQQPRPPEMRSSHSRFTVSPNPS